jgi:hypothetical protein
LWGAAPGAAKRSEETERVAKFRAAFLFAVRGGVTPQVAAKTTRCCKAQRKLRSALGSTLSLARF